MKKLSGWLLIHLRTAASTSASDKKILDLLTSPSILGTTRSLTVPNLGCKEDVEPLRISGLSWRYSYVHFYLVMVGRSFKTQLSADRNLLV
jgi:hypothetical protein